ncbi:MAG: ribosome recycling factor [Oscillospiraceae bacterium]|nr:ribosome recycling factor [Oscillospiraceae bacterium]
MGSYPEIEGKIAKTLAFLGNNYATLRAGRASAAVLDRISVDYYGTATPIAQVASVSTPEPRLLIIQPWDAALLKPIEKALQSSDLGIHPSNDGKVIRLAFPQLTEERRKELTKLVHKYGEESKVAVRNIRREAIDLYKKQQKKSEITEDDLRDTEREVQELTDKAIKDIDALAAKKEKELMEV